MARVRKRITAKKALQTFVMYGAAVGGALTQIDIPDGELSDKVLLTVGISTLAAVIRAVNNVRKTRKKPTDTGYGGVYYGTLLACVVALAGCVTTTAPDGTTTTQVDGVLLETALTRYDRYVARKELLDEEKRLAKEAQDAERVAIVQAEIDKLEPEIARLAERLGL